MTVEEIKKHIAKKAIEFTIDGLHPTNTTDESWFGRVNLYGPDEEIPTDNHDKAMLPLVQLGLQGLPFIPEILSDTRLITIFVSAHLPVECDPIPNGRDWCLREYKYGDELVVKELTNPASYIKPFPLKPGSVCKDYPAWDSDDIPSDIADEICKLEKAEGINYYDIVENLEGVKLGGYPAYIQSGVDYGEGFEFVLQIASDSKANFNVVDCGNIYLAKNSATGQWVYYCDFY